MIALQSLGTEAPLAPLLGFKEPRKVRNPTVPGASAAASWSTCFSWSASEPVTLYLSHPAAALWVSNVVDSSWNVWPSDSKSARVAVFQSILETVGSIDFRKDERTEMHCGGMSPKFFTLLVSPGSA